MRYRPKIALLLFSWLLFIVSPALAAADLSSMAKITGAEVREDPNGLEIIVNSDRPIAFRKGALSRPPAYSLTSRTHGFRPTPKKQPR